MTFCFCVGLYTNIDLCNNLLILHNYSIIYLTTIKVVLQIACLYKHISMDIVAFYKNINVSVCRDYPLIITY